MSEGKRATAAPASRGKRPALIAAATAAGVIVIAGGVFCGLCARASASTSETILPNISVLGLDVGGMTEQEAASAIETQLTERYADQTLTITVEGAGSVDVDVSNFISIDGSAKAKQAVEIGESSGFFGAGLTYLGMRSHELGAEDVISFQNTDTVYEQLQSQLSGAEQAPIPTSYQLTDTQIIFTNGTSGQAVDEAGLEAAVLEALQSGSYETTPVVCPVTQVSPESFDLQSAYDAVYTAPVDATVDENGDVVGDVPGTSFDMTVAQTALDSAAEGATVPVDLIRTDAALTATQLEALLFRDVLGTCTTTVSGSSARVSNVKLAASSCNEYILNPGETFSYNGVVGRRTTERGYKEASAYVNGETVESVGGGICQVSSTIYLATLRANLEIVERHNHSYVCNYMPTGQDATVYYGSLDFLFKNNTEYPIKIVAGMSGSSLTVQILGTNLTGEYAEMTSEVVSTSQYSTVYQDDPTMAEGKTSVKTTGYNGMVCKVYRNVYSADGTLLSTTLESTNTYKTRNKVVLVGTKSAAPVTTPAPETTAPETSAPETTAPETSAPETTVPETSAPETSTPETSAPDSSTETTLDQ